MIAEIGFPNMRYLLLKSRRPTKPSEGKPEQLLGLILAYRRKESKSLLSRLFWRGQHPGIKKGPNPEVGPTIPEAESDDYAPTLTTLSA